MSLHLVLWAVLLTVLFVATCGKADAEMQLTVATGIGISKTDGHLLELEYNYELNDYLNTTVGVGMASNSPYVDAGLSLNYWRVTIGCSMAYLYDVPKRLSMHGQFKPYVAFRVIDDYSFKIIHISNGSRKHPNYGIDFVGIAFNW